MQNKTVVIATLYIFLPFIGTAQDQMDLKFGVKAGYEFADYFISQSDGFKKVPGSAFTIFTGISSATNANATVILDLEFSYVRLFYYANNQQFLYNDYILNSNFNLLYNGSFSEQFSYKFVEVCFPIEIYPSVLNGNTTLGFYIGPAFGLGGKYVDVKEKSRTFVDSIAISPTDWMNESSPYSYPSGSSFCTPVSINLGATFFYRFFLIDLRYKYTFNISNSNSNLVLQLGLAY
jgi:hypothetical protein